MCPFSHGMYLWPRQCTKEDMAHNAHAEGRDGEEAAAADAEAEAEVEVEAEAEAEAGQRHGQRQGQGLARCIGRRRYLSRERIEYRNSSMVRSRAPPTVP